MDGVVTDVVADNVIRGGVLGGHYLCGLYSGVSLAVLWEQHIVSPSGGGIFASAHLRMVGSSWWLGVSHHEDPTKM